MPTSISDLTSLKTSSKTLNDFFGGGLMRGQIYTAAAPGGAGKTQIGLDLSFNLLKEGGSVLYIATEPLNLQRLNQLIKHKLGKTLNIKIPEKHEGKTLSKKDKYNFYRRALFNQLKKMGFFYVDVRDFSELKAAIKQYIGDYVPKGDEFALSIPQTAKKILGKVDLVVIDSITFTLSTQFKSIHKFGSAMKWEIATAALLETVAQAYNFAVYLPVQRISELSNAIKSYDRKKGQTKSALKALNETVNRRKYVGGKAIMHGSRVIIQIFGDENPRKVALIKSTHKSTGNESEIAKFRIVDSGISDV